MTTARELLDVIGHCNSTLRGDAMGQILASRVEKVLALHKCGAFRYQCRLCGTTWPCLTIRILNGEESDGTP